MDLFLLIFFTFFILITGIYIFKRNILFGGLYFFLFIYSIFAQIGYCFFPELSELAKAYFGKQAFYEFYFFNILSFLFFFIIFYFTYPILIKVKKYELIKESKGMKPYIFLFIIFCYFSFIFLYFINHLDVINWTNAADEDFLKNQGLVYKLFAASFKTLNGIAIIFYIKWRVKNEYENISFFPKSFLLFLLALSLVMLLLICNQIGSRTDIVAFILGVGIFEVKQGLSVKKILKFLTVTLVLLIFMLYLENARAENTAISEFSSAEKIIYKDYFAPAHMLYTAIGLNYINPLQVLTSNFANSFFLLNVDYLQKPLTDLINPGVATRSAGYAFYLFTEGYMFMGFFGFLYNGLMLMLGLSIWYLIYNSKNKYYNLIIFCLMSTQLVNFSRSQSSYFYKDIWVFLLPYLILFYLSSGLRLKLKF